MMPRDETSAKSQAETVEAVGWLLVDEEGRWEIFGRQEKEVSPDDSADFKFPTPEDFRRFLFDCFAPPFCANAQIYELRITVPRPARVKLSVEFRQPVLHGSVTGRASLEAVPIPTAGVDAVADVDVATEDVVDAAVAAVKAAPVPEGPRPEVVEAIERLDVDHELAAALRDWIFEVNDASGGQAAFKFKRDTAVIVALCRTHAWFTVRAAGRGHNISLSTAGRAAYAAAQE